MRETGGRAVERSLDLDVRSHGDAHRHQARILGDEVPEGGTAGFKVIHVDPAGAKKDVAGLQWSLVRVDRNYQWYRSSNYWNYEPITSTVAIAERQDRRQRRRRGQDLRCRSTGAATGSKSPPTTRPVR